MLPISYKDQTCEPMDICQILNNTGKAMWACRLSCPTSIFICCATRDSAILQKMVNGNGNGKLTVVKCAKWRNVAAVRVTAMSYDIQVKITST